jgi:phosphopantetheine--protein transferase-like protein
MSNHLSSDRMPSNPTEMGVLGAQILIDGALGDYGVGVDTEQVSRWRELLPSLRERRYRRLFTEREHGYCGSFPDAAPVYAGSWCAKEAVYKAVSRFGELTLDQIEIRRLETGLPWVQLPPALAERLHVRVSISHDTDRAIAFAVAVGRPLPRGALADELPRAIDAAG